MQREHGKRKRAHNASMHRKRMHRRYTQREHGRRKRDNASMHSASTKHGPAQPHDVDDFDERSAHDVDERCTSAPHAQHEGTQLEHGQHGHAQPAWARACTCRRQTARAHRAHSTGTQACAARAHKAVARTARTARARAECAGDAWTHMVHVCRCRVSSSHCRCLSALSARASSSWRSSRSGSTAAAAWPW